MRSNPPRIAYITAGAAGMYCGSCLHDNTLARALAGLGVDIQLVPTYTPIRTDEPNASIPRVFYGGLNVYLEQALPLFRRLPSWATNWLDRPGLIRAVAARAMGTSAGNLGGLTVSMLRGEQGYQKREAEKLANYLRDEAQPDVVVLSNALIAGCVPLLKQALGKPVLVTLQGDDVFLDSLAEPHRTQALAEIRRLAQHVNGFLAHSRFYADYISDYLHVPRQRIHVVPLGIDTHDFETPAALAPAASDSPVIGYLARLAPEKGLHVLVEAFLRLKTLPAGQAARLRVAGWLGASNREYAEAQFARVRAAGYAADFEYVGEVDRAGKVAFLQACTLFSVPAVFHEPKGLYVLEALAAGVPVVAPNHAAFPELLAATGGGELFPPNDATALATTLVQLLENPQRRQALAATGRANVLSQFNARVMAQRTLEVVRAIMDERR